MEHEFSVLSSLYSDYDDETKEFKNIFMNKLN